MPADSTRKASGHLPIKSKCNRDEQKPGFELLFLSGSLVMDGPEKQVPIFDLATTVEVHFAIKIKLFTADHRVPTPEKVLKVIQSAAA